MRLTNEMRNGITRAVVASVFENHDKILVDEEDRLATEIYSILYPKKILKIMDSLPDTFFAQSSTVYIEDGLLGNRPVRLSMISSHKVSSADNMGWCNPKLDSNVNADATCDLALRVRALLNSKQRVEKEKKELREALQCFLAGFNTTLQLNKEWTDWMIYYPVHAPSRAKVPAIRGSEIEKLIKTMRKKS